MDFIVSLPPSNSYSNILVVVDRLTKGAHFIPLASPMTALSVARAFSKFVVKHHGIPQSIVSDRDSIFLSSYWKEVFKMQGTQLKHSTSYHPQTDGQSEVVNRCLQQYLKCFASSKPSQWSQYVHLAEIWYNSSFHSSIGMSPFEATFGHLRPPLFYHDNIVTTSKAATDYRDNHMVIIDTLRLNLEKARHRMKSQADKGRSDIQFAVGDDALVKLQKYRQNSLAQCCSAKLDR